MYRTGEITLRGLERIKHVDYELEDDMPCFKLDVKDDDIVVINRYTDGRLRYREIYTCCTTPKNSKLLWHTKTTEKFWGDDLSKPGEWPDKCL